MKWSEKQLDLVHKRLKLVDELILLKNHFRGYDKIIDLENSWDHIYRDYSGLQNYLILTCFDILGQPSDWLDFNSWLKSAKKKEEREKIFSRIQVLDKNEFIIQVNNEYQSIYGVKSSFYKFLREIISEQNREKLLESINAQIELVPEKLEGDIRVSGTGAELMLSNEQKEKVLFEMRNSYTHKGISTGSPASGIFDLESPYYCEDTRSWKYHFLGVYIKYEKGKKVLYRARNWPHCLIEIVQDTIKIDNENQ